MDAYANGNPHERFSLIYKNYEVFLQLVDSFETGLLNQILFEVEYNRRAKNDDDLGVRIQNLRFSDPTASKAIEHIMIREAVEECNFSGNILKETDNPEYNCGYHGTFRVDCRSIFVYRKYKSYYSKQKKVLTEVFVLRVCQQHPFP